MGLASPAEVCAAIASVAVASTEAILTLGPYLRSVAASWWCAVPAESAAATTHRADAESGATTAATKAREALQRAIVRCIVPVWSPVIYGTHLSRPATATAAAAAPVAEAQIPTLEQLGSAGLVAALVAASNWGAESEPGSLLLLGAREKFVAAGMFCACGFDVQCGLAAIDWFGSAHCLRLPEPCIGSSPLGCRRLRLPYCRHSVGRVRRDPSSGALDAA